MRLINEIVLVVRGRSFPSFIDELYKRECALVALRHEEDVDEGARYTLRVAAPLQRRFDEFVNALTSARDKYRILSIKNIVEDAVRGGLLDVSGKEPLETMSDFSTAVLGAADFMRERIRSGEGDPFLGIARSVGLVSGVRFADDAWRLQEEYVRAERDAVILHRFTGMNGYPLALRFDHPEDVIRTIKAIEAGFAAIRIIGIAEAAFMLYELIHSEIETPVLSLEHDDLPLYILSILIKLMMKYRLRSEETTVGFVGIDVAVVRLSRVLEKSGFRKILGFDHAEKAMLDLENHGGLATTVENIFSNADITVIMKGGIDPQEYRTIRPGQFVLSLLGDEEPEEDLVAGKGVREFIRGDHDRLAAIFPGLVRGVVEGGLRSLSDGKLVECAKKLAGWMNDSFELPPVFGDIHERVCRAVAERPGEQSKARTGEVTSPGVPREDSGT